MTKDVISLSISVLLLFRHYISHKISVGAPSSGGVLCSACGAFIEFKKKILPQDGHVRFFFKLNNSSPFHRRIFVGNYLLESHFIDKKYR